MIIVGIMLEGRILSHWIERREKKLILHILSKEQWLAAQDKGMYTPPSLNTTGFVHCSTSEQIVEVANSLFRGQTGLVLLVIDPKKVSANVVFEDPYNLGSLFPHIYGPLNLDAVVEIMEFPPQKDGSFALPQKMNAYS